MKLNESGKMKLLEKAADVAKAAGEGGKVDQPDAFCRIIESVYRKLAELAEED